jgi:hypothetical protein
MKTTDKHLTKLRSNISKFCNVEITEKCMNMINKCGFFESMLFCLKIEDLNVFKILSQSGLKISYYKDLMRNNISSLIMASLNSWKSMRFALDLETEIQPIPESGKLNEQMIICVYRHMFVFPQNKEYCINCIRSYAKYKDYFIQRPFFYLQDNVEIAENFFSKNVEDKKFFFNNSIEAGAIKIFRKAMKFYKIDPSIYATLNIPILLENTKDFDIRDEENKDYLLAEACMNSRWDYLPFIFENFKIKDDDWMHFKFAIYQGSITLPFIQALFHIMEKKNYNYNLLVENSDIKINTVFCSDQIKDEFVKRGIDKNYNFKTEVTYTKTISCDIASLFDCYRTGNLVLLKSHLFTTYAHTNLRFMKEKDYALNLLNIDAFGWNENLSQAFYQFNTFCNDFCNKLKLCDIIILEYNSTLSIGMIFSPLITIRFLNRVMNLIAKISDEFLHKEYETLINSCNEDYLDNLKKVREEIDVDLDVTIPYEVNKDSTLEELFLNLYQNSNSRYINNESLITIEVLRQLKNRNMNYIYREVEFAITALVPIDDIIKILATRGVKFDLSKYNL